MKHKLALALLLSATPAVAAIERIGPPVPETATSQIYGRSTVAGAAQSIDLAKAGYVEREYFVTGTADAYERDAAGAVVVKTRAIPYTTRIIVRTPADPKRFSGFVHFEPIHPLQGGQSNWFATADSIMASGDAYVSASLGDDPGTRTASAKGPAPVAQSQLAKWYDPVRYAPLAWPAEDGIRFAVMADIGAYLRGRQADNPLHGLNVRRIVVEGWSFTGSLQRTFINEGFHDRARLPGGKPVFDGYLVGISSRWNGGGYLPLNSSEAPAPNASPRRALKPIDAPVVEFLSEFEVGTGPGPQLPDKDAAPGAHRLYELGGVIHGESLNDRIVARTGRPNLVQLAAKNYPFDAAATEARGGTPCPLPISDLPHGALARAAIANLKRWADVGTPPPKAPPLTVDAARVVQRDAAGNPLGGIRPAELDVPLARYGLYRGSDQPACVAVTGRPIILRQERPAAELKRRYGTVAVYDRLYDTATDRLVAGRWLLPVDAARLKAKAHAEAARDFVSPAE